MAKAKASTKSKRSFYCVKCKSKVNEPVSSVVQTSNGRFAAKGTCSRCGTKLSTFVSAQEGNGLLSMLGVDTGGFKDFPILGQIFG